MTNRIRLALGAVGGALLVAPAGGAAPALAAPAEVTLRVEGASQTIHEGRLTTDGRNVTTASGGTHKCDGTNGGVNPEPGPTATAALDDGARLGGFTWDGTWDEGYQDYFVTRIGPDTQTDTQFWGLLVNSQFSQEGGCRTRVRQGDEVLWAYDAFSKSAVLRLSGPDSAHTGEAVTVTVTDGQDGSPESGTSVGGSVTGGDGRATLVFAEPGVYRLKAERSDAIRSNALVICVDPHGAPPCTSSDRVAPTLRVLLPGAYASDGSRSRTILVAWQGDDPAGGSGVKNYGLDVREVPPSVRGAAAEWRTVVEQTDRTGAHFRGASGTAYEFRVRATDRAGNRGELVSGPLAMPVDDRDRRLLRFSHGWRRLERKNAWGRFVVRSRRAGASARLRFRGSRVAVIGRMLPKGGRLRVTVGRRSRTVRLRGEPRFRQVLFVSRRLRPGTQTVRLKAVGGGPVEIDAVAPLP